MDAQRYASTSESLLIRLLARPAVQLIIVGILGALIYGSMLSNGFTYDDYLVIVDNPHITRPGFLKACFTQDYFVFSGEGSYRPFITAIYYSIVGAFGKNALVFHSVALALHVLSALLILLLMRRLGANYVALWAGVAFVIHPILTEPVCGIGFSEDVWATTLLLIGTHIFLYAARKTQWRSRIVALILVNILVLLASLSKESGLLVVVLAPLAVLLSPRHRVPRRTVLSVSLMMLPAAFVYLIMRFVIFPGHGGEAERLGSSVVQSILTFSVIVVSYIGRLVYPLSLSVLRSTPVVTLTDPRLLLALVIHVPLLTLAWRSRRRRPICTFGILWFYAALLPVANIIPIFHPEADRYLYLPAIGLFMAAAELGRHTCHRFPASRRWLQFAAVLSILAWSYRTTARLPDWRSNMTLWSHEDRLAPTNPTCLTELAVQENAIGDHRAAERAARLALREAKGTQRTLAHLHLGMSLTRQQRYKQALAVYRDAITNDAFDARHFFYIWQDLGFIYEQAFHDLPRARDAYTRALRLNPYSLDTALTLGVLHAQAGDTDSATNVWKTALKYHSTNSALLLNLEIAKRRGVGCPKATARE